jgi:oxygen-independent coproporphyrinogen III oxidase
LYVSLLFKELEMYHSIVKGKKIVGYDMGGETPTKLSVKNLKKITEAVTNTVINSISRLQTTKKILQKGLPKIMRLQM